MPLNSIFGRFAMPIAITRRSSALVFLSVAMLFTFSACKQLDKANPDDGDTTQENSGDAGSSAEGDTNGAGDSQAEGDANASDGEGSNSGGTQGGGDSTASAQRLAFEIGSDEITLDDRLPGGGGRESYVLTAFEGQEMLLDLGGVSNGSVTMDIVGPDGRMIATSAKAPLKSANELVLELPSTGEYLLNLSSNESAPPLNYTLRVRITGEASTSDANSEEEGAGEADSDENGDDENTDEGNGEEAADDTASDTANSGLGDIYPVFFDDGATSTSIEGELDGNGDIDSYSLRAQAGQQLQLKLSGPDSDELTVMVFDAGGNTLRSTSTAALNYDLSQDEEYFVTVSNSGEPKAASYALTIEIPTEGDASADSSEDGDTDADQDADQAAEGETDLADGELPVLESTPIFFEAGATSALVEGELSSGGTQRYSLRAGPNQIMKIELKSVPADAQLQVFVEDSTTRVFASGLENEVLEAQLDDAQDYVIAVVSPIGGVGSSFELRVTIE